MTPFWEWREAPWAQFAVIGDPISHSLSPKMHSAALQELGLPHRYVAVRVPVGEVHEALAHLASLGYLGANVTVPHKPEAFLACRTVEPFAQRIGAVNTIRLPDMAGTNTDGPGFWDTLGPFGFPKGSNALVLGAGGTARAVLAVLAEQGFRLSVFNRTPGRAEALLSELGIAGSIAGTMDPAGAALVVNTTSAEMHGGSLDIDWASASLDTVAYDIVYRSDPTPFIRGARQAGLRTVEGRSLLAAQGARSLEWWLGVAAPRQAMLESLSE